MINLEEYLYNRIRMVFDGWDEDGIYAVSFFVYSNELYEYRGFSNVTNLSVSYNTENDCDGAGRHSEERWNYAFWRQNETPIFDSYEATPETDVLFDWYAQQGITNVGYEEDGMEAPVGFAELVEVLSKVARRFHDEGYFVKRFGRAIPILIHDLEYIPCTLKATAYANPDGEAADFLAGDWETAEPDYDDPEFQRINSEISAISDDALSHFDEKVNTTDPDPDVDAIMKILFGDDYKK